MATNESIHAQRQAEQAKRLETICKPSRSLWAAAQSARSGETQTVASTLALDEAKRQVRRLSDAERQRFVLWVAAGMPAD